MGKLLEKVTAKLPEGLRKRLSHGSLFLKIFGVCVAATFLSIILTTIVWFRVHPLNSYRPFIANYLRTQLQADELSLGDLSWKFSLPKLSLGVAVENLSFRRDSLLHRFKTPHFEFSVVPLKALFGKVPLSISSKGGNVELTAIDRATIDTEENPEKTFLSRWLKRSNITLHLQDLSINIDPKLFSRQEAKVDEATTLFFEVKDIDASIGAVPGPFKAHLMTELDFDWPESKRQVVGPAEFDLDGYFLTVGDAPLGAHVESFHADLSKTKIVSGNLFEKPSGQELWFESKVQVLFDDKFLLSKIDLTEAQLHYQELIVANSVSIDTVKKEISARWDSGRREVSKLHFPVPSISDLPFRGNFESTGTLKLTSGVDPFIATKLSLNNFKVTMRDLAETHRVDAASKGALSFSLVTEFTLKDRNLSSPRFELQGEGRESQIELQGGRFTKPRNDEMSVLVKGNIIDNILKVDRATAKLNNLEFGAKLEITGFNSIFHHQDGAVLDADFKTNQVNLTEWSAYFPWFRKVPLQGFVEGEGNFAGPIKAENASWRDFAWRIERASATQVRGTLDGQNVKNWGIAGDHLKLSGPFAMDLQFQGRGRGEVVQKAALSSMVDLSAVNLNYKDEFNKPAGQPMTLDVSAEETQNKLLIRRGTLRLFDNAILLSGNLVQGSKRNSINIKLDKPERLESLKPYFKALPDGFPELGQVSFEGKFGFDSSTSLESDLDWGQFGFDGHVLFQDVALQTKPFAYPVTGLSGGVWIEKNRLLYPNLKFQVRNSRFLVSGESSLAPNKKDRGNLASFIANETPWSISAQVDVDKFNEEIFGDKPTKAESRENMKNHQNDVLKALEEFVKTDRAQKSKLDLRFRAHEVTGDSKVKSRDLISMIKWNGSRLTLDPMSVRALGGSLRGSFVYDVQGYYQRKDVPQISLKAKFEDMDFGALASLYNPWLVDKTDGRIRGEVSLAADGFDVQAMRDSARGRLKGHVDSFVFEPMHSVENGLNVLIKSSDAADYLAAGSDASKCLNGDVSADLDGNLERGDFVMQRFALANIYGNGQPTRLNAAGTIKNSGELNLRGKLLPGPACLQAQASACLEEKIITFSMKDRITAPKLQMDVESAGRRIASCLSTQSDKQARKAINEEAQHGSQAQKEERALRDRIRSTIQGKKVTE